MPHQSVTGQGTLFCQALETHKPLQIVGTVNAHSALMAQQLGHHAIYLSGGGVAACSMGTPDLGITTLADVVTDTERIKNVCELPLLVDIDTGWGGAFNISRAVRELTRAGAAAVHMEDQVQQKRCGHRPNKEIVSCDEMCDRIKAAVDGKTASDFVIMARTDALQRESLDSAVERACRYVEAGADMIFPEAVYTLEQYSTFKASVKVPILANITEFGQTPLFTVDELKTAGVDMVLYPLSAFRAMSKAAESVYRDILATGTQKDHIGNMQTREELYNYLNYHSYEKALDKYLEKNKS